MATLIVQPKVRNCSDWRPAFDGHKSRQTEAGLARGRVYRGADDPNDIVILFDVMSSSKARSFVGSDDLKATMRKAGVLGAPVVHLIEGK
jgi:hypothetical protein